MFDGGGDDGDKHRFAHAPLHGALHQIARRTGVQGGRLRGVEAEHGGGFAQAQGFQEFGLVAVGGVGQLGGFV